MYALKNGYSNFFMFLCLLLMKQEKLAKAVRKYIHRKDVSEYCRRHVLPSVFLGRHVLDANSQILHFSRLELPYSCSISVRAESGSNIILVIKSISDNSLINSCAKNHHQLLVYEIGETFGGYWAALPDSVMRQEVNNSTELYTLKATQPTTTAMDYSSENENDDASEEITEKVKLKQNTNSSTNGDYIRVEVPLVNVSGKFSMDEFQPQNIDEMFDIINDLTPREGVFYDTSILPLVQFSMLAPKGSLRSEITTEDMKFISDYRSGIYTPDSRFFQTPIKPYMSTADSTSKLTVQRNDTSLNFNDLISGHITKPQEISYKIFKTFSHPTLSRKIPNFLLQTILDERNTSVYLLPNLSVNNDSRMKYANMENVTNLTSKSSKASLNGVTRLTQITKRSQTITIKILSTSASETMSREISVNSDLKFQENHSNISTFTNRSSLLNADKYKRTEDLHNSKKTGTTENLRNYSVVILNKPNNSSAKINKNTELVTGSMVNHESWENVVQAAPVMAILLNKTLPEDNTESADITDRTELNSTVKVEPEYLRKKRYVHALEVNNARPRVFTATGQSYSTTKSVDNLMDMQDVGHLVEMKNDEMHGHVALRYMRNYVGPVLFNICDYKALQTRRVHLFNTSRIVIAISNFTLEKMTLIMTPARTLRRKENNCPAAHLECQISGARVCIDSLSACDGVPNCGAYDIYDEDRLMCGEPSGLQHNVYLAACTFLAVLLTLLYTVHYWLKRCVPRVSEAFFIYTDRSENILNLETIMRSPNDDDDDSKIMYGGHFFEDDELDIDNSKFKQKFFKKVWRLCLGICLKHQPKKDEDEETSAIRPPPKQMSSFAALELSKIGPKRAFDVCVQTEDSLEHALNYKIKPQNVECKELFYADEYEKLKKDKNTIKRKHTDELNILKFMKESRSDSIQSDPVNESSKLLNNFNKNLQLEVDDEKELLSTVYEPQSSASHKINSSKVITRCDVHSEKKEPNVRKHLRFDEAATTIPSVNTDEEILDRDEQYRKPHVVLGTEKLRYSGTMDKLEKQGYSSGREFMRFLSGSKVKKSKKKKNVTTH